MATFLSATPLVPTGNSLAEALEFYTKKMGFTIKWQSETMAGISRDGVSFNLVESNNKEWVENASISIGVSNVDELYEEYRGRSIPIGALELKFWGRREFHMIIAGVCLQFYTL